MTEIENTLILTRDDLIDKYEAKSVSALNLFDFKIAISDINKRSNIVFMDGDNVIFFKCKRVKDFLNLNPIIR